MARETLGLSQQEMAQRLLTPRSTYAQWESGARRTPGVAVVAAEAIPYRPIGPILRPATMRGKVAVLLDAGLRPKEIADRLGISRKAAYTHISQLQKAGGRPPDRPRSPQMIRREDVAALADGTRTVAEIAAALASIPQVIYSHIHNLRRAGIAAPVKTKSHSVIKTKRNSEIVMLRESGLSYSKIGSRYGISGARAQQICAREKKRNG